MSVCDPTVIINPGNGSVVFARAGFTVSVTFLVSLGVRISVGCGCGSVSGICIFRSGTMPGWSCVAELICIFCVFMHVIYQAA